MSSASTPATPPLIREAFYRDQAGHEMPCDAVRFAIGDRESGIRSAFWSATCSNARNSTDMFMFTEGLGNDAKVTFHSKDAVVAYRSEKMQDLLDRQVVPPGTKRQTESVPILDEPFLVASIAFFPGVLKRPEKWRPPTGKPTTVISTPPMDLFVRVHVVHSYDEPAQLQDHVSGHYLEWFARLRNGNRHLTFFHLAYPVDWEIEKLKLQAYVEQIPARDDLRDLAENGDLSSLFWGSDETHLNFFEIHTLGIKKQD